MRSLNFPHMRLYSRRPLTEVTITAPDAENDFGYLVAVHSSAISSGKFGEAFSISREAVDGYTAYSASISGAYATGDVNPVITVTLGNTVAAEGYLIEGDLTSRVHPLTDGMEITVIYKDPTHADAPLYHEKGTLIWGKNAEFSIQKVAAGYDQYIPYVVDIYGNIHYGPATVVYFDGLKSALQNPTTK